MSKENLKSESKPVLLISKKYVNDGGWVQISWEFKCKLLGQKQTQLLWNHLLKGIFYASFTQEHPCWKVINK